MTALQKPQRVLDPKYLQWIRNLECLCSPDEPCFPSVEAHHVAPRGGGKVGSKADDSRAVPLCSIHHRSYHAHGRTPWEAVHRIDLEAAIVQLNERYAKEKR